MKLTPLRVAAFLGSIAVGCFATGLYFSFRSICTADLKGGNWGDIGLALELESISLRFAFAGLAVLLVVFGIVFRHHDRTWIETLLLSVSVVFVIAIVVHIATLLLSYELLPFCPDNETA